MYAAPYPQHGGGAFSSPRFNDVASPHTFGEHVIRVARSIAWRETILSRKWMPSIRFVICRQRRKYCRLVRAWRALTIYSSDNHAAAYSTC